MVRLFINQEYMAKQDRMIVKDESGQDVFLMVGRWGRLGDQLSVFSIDGTRLVDAKQVVLSVFPKFRLFQDDRKIGTLKKRRGLKGIKNPFFTVTRLNWIVTGNYKKQHFNFTVRHFGKKILTIDKTASYMGEFYILNLNDDQYAPVACVLAVLLDHYVDSKDRAWKVRRQEKYSLSFMSPVWMKLKQILMK